MVMGQCRQNLFIINVVVGGSQQTNPNSPFPLHLRCDSVMNMAEHSQFSFLSYLLGELPFESIDQRESIHKNANALIIVII